MEKKPGPCLYREPDAVQNNNIYYLNNINLINIISGAVSPGGYSLASVLTSAPSSRPLLSSSLLLLACVRWMDRSRPSTSSSQEQSLQNPFASNDSRGNLEYSSSSSPQPESPRGSIVPGFPFHTHSSSQQGYITQTPSSNSIHQRRNNNNRDTNPMSRPGTATTHLSATQASADTITFAPRARDPPPASFMGPPRIGSMASRDSAFAAPPVRQATPSINDGNRSRPVKAIPFKSTALIRDADGNANIEKPWLEKKDPYVRISYFVTWSLFLLLGFGGSGLAIFLSWRAFPKIPNYCMVMEDNFDSLDPSKWTHEVDLSGMGNGQFDMSVASTNNSYVQNGMLYITPTLTEDVIGAGALTSGPAFNLTGCTNTIIDSHNNSIPNPDACGVVPNSTKGIMVPPIMSARITTKGKFNIAYGKVTVRAKLPRGYVLSPLSPSMIS